MLTELPQRAELSRTATLRDFYVETILQQKSWSSFRMEWRNLVRFSENESNSQKQNVKSQKQHLKEITRNEKREKNENVPNMKIMRNEWDEKNKQKT